MYIRLESSSGVPIVRQICDQLRSQAASGAIEPGDRLPSVRQLARELAVNQNTILRVYERLTSEGLLERRHGDGTYVAENLPRGRARAQRELLVQEMDRIAHKAADLDIDLDEILKMFETSFARARKERTVNQGDSHE